MPFEKNPDDGISYCTPHTFRELMTNCEMHMSWWNYFGAGLVGLILTIFILLVIIIAVFFLLYFVPLNIGNAWNNILLKKKDKRTYYYDFVQPENFDIQFYLYGWLIIIIVLSCLAILAVGFYWLGHLFVLGQ